MTNKGNAKGRMHTLIKYDMFLTICVVTVVGRSSKRKFSRAIQGLDFFALKYVVARNFAIEDRLFEDKLQRKKYGSVLRKSWIGTHSSRWQANRGDER